MGGRRWLFQLSKHNQVGALTEIGKVRVSGPHAFVTARD
jgi:hypothetical protein